RLGMSRTPVRTALTMLAEEGLVQPIGTGGFSARAFSERDVNDAIELRGTLEGLAARLAAERGISTFACRLLADLLAQLDEVVTAPVLDVDDMERYIDLNARLHREIIRLAESRVVERQIERVMALPFASPSAFVMAQSRCEDARNVLVIAQYQHRAVVEAIIEREGARAEALMREHSRVARRNLGQAVRSREALEQVPGGKLIQLHRQGED
ncbi:MAG TPA: GntR family transcriptional regulator, partial [Rhabdaerophilum sp.]|nr:GntR family transcriptional regulator [Rhabdaerophilum sp.]